MQTVQPQTLYSATTFRHLLDSLAQPGKLTRLGWPDFWGASPVDGVNLYALGALQTLLDRETRAGLMLNGQWLSQDAPLWKWLALRSGAGWAEPEEADFVLFCDGHSAGYLPNLKPGTLLEPEGSATAFYSVERLSDEPITGPTGLTLQLSGPGIADTRQLTVQGLNPDELKLIEASRQGYPLGVDVYLVDSNGQCAGLPRTTRISQVAGEVGSQDDGQG